MVETDFGSKSEQKNHYAIEKIQFVGNRSRSKQGRGERKKWTQGAFESNC